MRRANRPRSLRSNKPRVWRTSVAKEVKIAQSKVELGRFGLFIVLLGRSSTGSSFSAPRSHGPYCSIHFVPLCTTILPVSRLLSSRNLMVAVPLLH